MIFTGDDAHFRGDGAGMGFDDGFGEGQILRRGGGAVFQPDPLGIDAQGRQLPEHTLRFRNLFPGSLTAGNHADHIRVGRQIFISGIDALPQQQGGNGAVDTAAKDDDVIRIRLRVSQTSVKDECKGHGGDQDADAQTYA